MIYHYIAELTLGAFALCALLAYQEEKKARKYLHKRASEIIREDHEIMEEMEAENLRLAIVAKAYRIAAMNQPEN